MCVCVCVSFSLSLSVYFPSENKEKDHCSNFKGLQIIFSGGGTYSRLGAFNIFGHSVGAYSRYGGRLFEVGRLVE